MYVEVLEILDYFLLQHINLVKELTKDSDNNNNIWKYWIQIAYIGTNMG